jgi:ribonucleoside-diphosphate reductase alpha chain
MRAVERGEDYDLIDPRTGKPAGKLNAREVFDKIVENAWHNGEPGIVFLDRLNRDNVLIELGEIESTNPCVTGDTWVLTQEGPAQVADIVGKQVSIALNGNFYSSTEQGFFKTGRKQVIKIHTDRGYSIEVTPDHKIRVASLVTRDRIEEDWKPAGELKSGDQIILSNNRGLVWEGKGTFEEGYLLGLLIGDGTLKDEGGVISVWGDDQEAQSVMDAAQKAAFTLPHREDFKGFKRVISERKEHRLEMAALRDLAAAYGIVPGNNRITENLERTSYEFHRGFLRGLFDADGTVAGHQEKGVSIRLWHSDTEGLRIVQRMLLRLGIASTIYLERKSEDIKEMPDGKGGMKEYSIKAGHELVITSDNMQVFFEKVGFSNVKKQELLRQRLEEYKRALNRERFVATVTEIISAGEKDVFDVQIPGVNAFDANGIYVHNCGEQPLLPYESCNLGSINLSRMVEEVDGKYVINYDKLGRVVDLAVHFLDNVIDVNKYPLPQIEEMTKGSRKIGLGVMGFADMLFKLGIPYNSDEAVELARQVMKFIQERSKEMSAHLAEVRGPFPFFEKSTLRHKGRKLRNATTTTIAPTGTISIICGTTSGIEPLFAISFVRNVMDNDELVEVHPYFKEVAIKRGFYSDELMRKIAARGSIQGMEEIPEDVRRVFVTAHDVSPEYHVRMQAAFQEYTDNAVSKTVNFPNSATVEDVRKVYWLAYELGCKGVTIYRDGSRESQVLSVKPKEDKPAEDKPREDKKEKSGSLTEKIYSRMKEQAESKQPRITPRPRPDVTMGFTEKVKIGCGNLYITVNYDEQGICEVFTNLGRAGGCPSQSEATSRLISIALRSGMDVDTIIEQLKGIRCHSTLRQKGLKVLSCPDAIGRVLEKVVKLRLNNNLEAEELDIGSPDMVDRHSCLANCSLCSLKDVCNNPFRENGGIQLGGTDSLVDDNPPQTKGQSCPECGATMEHDGGCVVCRSCGYSKCG